MRLKSTSPYHIPVALANSTDKAFNYIFNNGEILGFEYNLRQRGKLVRYDGPTPGPGSMQPVYVKKELKPSETLTFSYKLRHLKLDPGEYALELSFRVYKGSTLDVKYEATPVDLTLHYTLIVE